MKLFIIYMYMILSGVIGGVAHNIHHERCQTKGVVSTSDIIGALLWPMALGYSITIDYDKFVEPECESE